MIICFARCLSDDVGFGFGFFRFEFFVVVVVEKIRDPHQSRSHCLIGMLPKALFNIFLNNRPMLCEAAGRISWTSSLALVFKN